MTKLRLPTSAQNFEALYSALVSGNSQCKHHIPLLCYLMLCCVILLYVVLCCVLLCSVVLVTALPSFIHRKYPLFRFSHSKKTEWMTLNIFTPKSTELRYSGQPRPRTERDWHHHTLIITLRTTTDWDIEGQEPSEVPTHPLLSLYVPYTRRTMMMKSRGLERKIRDTLLYEAQWVITTMKGILPWRRRNSGGIRWGNWTSMLYTCLEWYLHFDGSKWPVRGNMTDIYAWSSSARNSSSARSSWYKFVTRNSRITVSHQVKIKSRLKCFRFEILMDNLHYRIIFDLNKSRRKKRNSRKEPFKSSKIPKFGWKMLWCVENIAIQSLQVFSSCYVRKLLHFRLKSGNNLHT